MLRENTENMLSVLSLLVTLQFVSAMDADTVDLLTPSLTEGESCGYESCPRIKPDELNVHIVPNTHFEIGQSATFENHFTGKDDFFDKTVVTVKNSFDHVLQELWERDERKFTISDIAYFFHWWSKRDHTVRRMVYTLLRQGRLNVVGGGFVIPDEATTTYHALIETFTYALRMINSTFLNCGRPLVTWQVDVLGHSREMASLVAQMGFDGHFISPISFDDHVARMQRQGMEFVWRGNDDIGVNSDIFTHVLFDGHRAPPGFCFSSRCSDPLIVISDSAFRNDDERAKAFVQSMRYRQSPHYNTSNVLVVMGTSNGYHDARMWFNSIDNLIVAINRMSSKKGKNVNVFYSTPYCYLRAVHEAQPELETKQDDFYPFAGNSNSYGTGLYTTAPPVKLLVREALQHLHIAKQLQVLARLYNNDRKFEELQWIFGLFQDHTVITGNMRDYVKKNYIQRLFDSTQRSLLIMKQAFNKIRLSPSGTIYYNCQFNMSTCNVGDRFLLIYNPLSWPVTVPVRMPSHKAVYRVYNSKGQEIPTSMVSLPAIIPRMPGRMTDTGHELVFIAQDIPPIGFRSYFIQSLGVTRHARNTNDYDSENASKQRKKRSAPGHHIKTSTENNRHFNDTDNQISEDQINSSNFNEVKNNKFKTVNNTINLRTHKNKTKNNYLKNKNTMDHKIKRKKLNNTEAHKIYKIAVRNNTEINKVSNINNTEINKLDNINNTVNNKVAHEHNINRKGIFNNKNDDGRRSQRAFVAIKPDKMAIIKKINKSKVNKKYLIVRQADQNINDQPLVNDMESDYEYFDEDVRKHDATIGNETIEAPETIIGEAISYITDNMKNKALTLDNEDSDTNKDILANQQINTESKTNNEQDTEQIGKTLEVSEIPRNKDETKKNSKEDITEQITRTFGLSGDPQNNTSDEYYDSSNDTDNEVSDSEKHSTISKKDSKEILGEVNIKTKDTPDVQAESDVDKTKLNAKETKSTSIKDVSIKIEKSKSYENSDSAKVLEEMRKEANIQLNARNDETRVENEEDNREIDAILSDDKKIQNTTPKTEEPYKNDKSKGNKNADYKTTTYTYDYMNQITNNTVVGNISLTYVPKKVIAEKKIDGRKKFRYDAEDEIQGLYEISRDNFIENKYVKLTLDPNHRKINGMHLSNGVNISLDMQFYYYVSDDPDRTYNYKWSHPNEEQKEDYKFSGVQSAPPGVYLFRSIDNKPVPILDYLDVKVSVPGNIRRTKVLKTDIVQEVQYHYADYASLSVRLYVDSPVVETDWIIGHIPFTSDMPEYLGTDIFIRYMTDLQSDGVFFTDANGRQTIKRIRDMRPTYDHVNKDPVAGNFYPVTSKISIVDESRNIRLSVLTDRSQGGASLADGEIDLMLHRRICTDDQNRLGIFANDTEFGKPIWVRGTHRLYLSKDDYRPNRIFEKKLAKELNLSPLILTSKSNPYGVNSKDIWSKHVNEHSYITNKPPMGIHLLTLQEWNDHTILIRLENYLEKSDVIKTGVKTVVLRDLFKNLQIKSVRETTLAGNIWMKDFMPLLWKKKDRFVKSFNDFYATGKPVEWADEDYSEDINARIINHGIVIKPQQIRTFVCEYDFV